MISIIEDTSKKVSGLTSFYISFEYDKDIVSSLSSIECKYYHKKEKIWEIPLVNLQETIDKLTIFDDIQLKLKDDVIKHDVIFDIKNEGKTKLFKHQLEAVNYGLNHERWLLLDLPGCGKSLSSLTLASEIRKKHNISHCLIISGLNILKYNWVKEINKHTYLSATILGSKVNKNGKTVVGSIKERLAHLKSNIEEFFIITNIETLRDENIANEIINNPEKFPMIIFDEIHKCKDPSSLAGNNILKTVNSKFKLGMTGTLLLNSPLDAYVPLKWIGIEKSSYTYFKKLYCNLVGKNNNIIAGFKHLDYLSWIISQCSLRRSNYSDLPPLNLITEYVEMEGNQEKFYNDLVKGVKEEVDKVELNTANTLAMTTRLRQATALPGILTSRPIPSAKIDRACELVDSIASNGDKTVIFSTFKPTVKALEIALKDYNPVIFTGDSNDNIMDIINTFESDPAKKVFIATWQKIGAGVDIIKPSYCIFIDTPWTWGTYEQAYKRLHRTGASKPVFVIELITKNTFDEDVHEILYDKQAISNYVMDYDMSDSVVNRLKKKLLDIK